MRDDPRARCYFEVNTAALLHNYAVAQGYIAPPAQMIAVLKADAYGYGLVPVGKLLFEHGVRMFSVACLNEAFALREALPEAWILCMGETLAGNIEAAVEAGIRLTCGAREAAWAISEAAQALGLPAFVHFKVDTGLRRLGFDPADVDDMADCARLPGIVPEGLYTHLALHDLARDEAQVASYERVSSELHLRGVNISMRHVLDSIGLVRYPRWQMDAVRVGGLLYGNYAADFERPELIQPVGTFCARVTRVFEANEGDLVGYDSERALARDSILATISCGYADGYPRALSNRGQVVIRGRRAQVVGLICMDQMMVDVTDIPAVRRGDVATLLGEGITLREYAAIGELNRNECTAVIGKRVPRIYV